MKIFHRFSQVLADSRGASIVELGLAAPLVAYLFMGMVDVASGIATKHRLEQAAQRAIERATSYGTAGSDFSDIDDEAATAANVPIDEVTFDQWLECNGVRQAAFDGICPEGEEIGRYVKVDIDSGYTPNFAYGPLARLVDQQDDGRVPISVDASVRIQ